MKRGNGEMSLALDELAECIPDRASVEDTVEAGELSEIINRFLRQLPEKDCNIFLRRYWYMEDCGAIAARFGMKVNTVKTSCFRTRGKLREYLEREGISV